jgi:phosphatidylinositol 4-kinase A
MSFADSADLGATIAQKFSKAIGPADRQLCKRGLLHASFAYSMITASMSGMSNLKSDRAKLLSSQTAFKAYFAGEAAGTRLAQRGTYRQLYLFAVHLNQLSGHEQMEKIAPEPAAAADANALKAAAGQILRDIRTKSSHLTIRELKRILFRCAAMIISLDQVRLQYRTFSLPLNEPVFRLIMTWFTTWWPYHLRSSRHRRFPLVLKPGRGPSQKSQMLRLP